MNSNGVRRLSAIVVIALLVFGLFLALTLDSDFGKVEVKTITISDGDKELSGLLYRPQPASADNPFPAIVIAHGISSSKEMMSSIGLELSRQSIVTLCLDLLGHGRSGGTVNDGTRDPSFGVLAAVQYLEAQPFVDSSRIGLIGHSLGAGAVRATVAADNQIEALVLIAGGLGNIVESPEYGQFNSTFPKNLLVIVGKYDVLFNLTEVTTEELPPMFGTQQEVVQDVTYRSIAAKTARKFVAPATTHLFEPFDSTAISEIVEWMKISLIPQGSAEAEADTRMIYVARESAILFALIGLFGIVFLMLFPVSRILRLETSEIAPVTDTGSKVWKRQAVWGVLNIALFLPMLAAGLAIPFPPLLFGRSIAWWMLAVGLVGTFLNAVKHPRFLAEPELKEKLKQALNRKQIILASALFLMLFTGVSLIEVLFNLDFRIITPIFRILTDSRRIFAFSAFLPFFLAYFLGEGMYLYDHPNLNPQGKLAVLREYGSTIFAKIAPFLAIICLQYLPKLLFDVWILPGFAGFIFEFLWLIVPIFIITTTCSWRFYRNTQKIGAGMMFNTLMMAWVAAAVFPF
jgi:dienelactone hydrolase